MHFQWSTISGVPVHMAAVVPLAGYCGNGAQAFAPPKYFVSVVLNGRLGELSSPGGGVRGVHPNGCRGPKTEYLGM